MDTTNTTNTDPNAVAVDPNAVVPTEEVKEEGMGEVTTPVAPTEVGEAQDTDPNAVAVDPNAVKPEEEAVV